VLDLRSQVFQKISLDTEKMSECRILRHYLNPAKMKITIDETKPIENYAYLKVGTGQTSDGKSNIEFLVICSDLQGAVEKDGEYQLLGEELPEFLKFLIEIELSEIEHPKIGVLLCGDLFTNLEKRGASGDVRAVWRSFKKQFDWVIGVAGNHDRFGTPKEKEEFKAEENIYLLHQEIKEIDHLKIGGISGIIGRKDKTNRVDEKQYLGSLKNLLKKDLDFILLHQTPDYPSLGLMGNEKIRAVIEKGQTTTICCGHCHWDKFEELMHLNQFTQFDDMTLLLLTY